MNALDLIKLSMYIENSFRFSGRTSWPGGCEPEKILRYPLNISTVFSEILFRISLRFLSSVFEAAVTRSQYVASKTRGHSLTLLGDDRDHGILINVFHCLHAAFIDCSYDIDTTDPPLTIRGRVQ